MCVFCFMLGKMFLMLVVEFYGSFPFVRKKQEKNRNIYLCMY